jgi:phytoene dehydrogenase-like protein
LREVYEGLGVADDMAFFEMNPQGFEHIRIGEEVFDIPAGKDIMVEAFKTRFPGAANGIDRYFSLLYTICEEMRCIPETKSLIDFLTVPFRTWNMGRYGLFSLEHILRRWISDPLARAFLSIPCGDHGLPPSRVPFAMHAPVAGHYFNGAYYPSGGADSIPKALIRGFAKEKGEILLSTPVERVLIEKRSSRRCAIGVRLEDGSELRAGRVVSNASPEITYNRLVGYEHISSGLRKKLCRTRYSIAAAILFLATDLDLESMGMDSGNYWYIPHRDLESFFKSALHPDTVNDPLPGIFFGITTLKDPSGFTGHHTIEAVRFLAYEAFASFAGSANGRRSKKEYLNLKSKVAGAMLKSLGRVIPGIGDHILFSELGTPLTFDHYVRSTRGSCYGTEKSFGQIGPFCFKQFSEIENLCLCGASILHGVSGASLSGLHLAAAVLGCRPSELLLPTGQNLKIFSPRQPDQWKNFWQTDES